jgi:hypothetical protein
LDGGADNLKEAAAFEAGAAHEEAVHIWLGA